MTLPATRHFTQADHVACVIVHYAGVEKTRRAVDAVQSSTAPPGLVMVVDQSEQPDQQWDASLSVMPEIRVVRQSNQGFAAGVNAGIEAALMDANCHAVWLLNPDSECDPDALSHMLAWLRPTTAVGARLQDPAGRIDALGGGRWSWWRARALAAITRPQAESIEYLCAACLLFHRDTLDRVGPLDPSFFLYGEDVDWGLRMQAAGISLAVAHDAVITHISGQGGAATVADYYEPRNALRLVRRDRPAQLVLAVVYRVYRSVLPKLVRGQWDRLRLTLAGLRDSLQRTPITGRMDDQIQDPND